MTDIRIRCTSCGTIMFSDYEQLRQHAFTHVDVNAKLLALFNEKPEPFPLVMERVEE